MEVRDINGRLDFGIIAIRRDEFEAALDRFLDNLGIISARREHTVRRIAPNAPYAVAIVRYEQRVVRPFDGS